MRDIWRLIVYLLYFCNSIQILQFIPGLQLLQVPKISNFNTYKSKYVGIYELDHLTVKFYAKKTKVCQ